LIALVLAAETQTAPLAAVKVPAKLLEVTSNPEFSGIVWSAARRRYLVVTDDSGRRSEGSNHQPLLLALSEAGVLDETPVPILGIDKLNDPESICAGPDGTYFVVTSHSPNREGKTPPARRQLLHLRDAKKGLEVIGRADLTRVTGGKGLLDSAGLPADGRIDIEAVTFHDHALFIGFKSPLTSTGAAAIVRIENPLDVLREGKLRSENFRPFAQLRLCAAVDGQSICEGISDMMFLPSGELILSANSPKGGPKDHGGALWLVPQTAQPAPVLVRRFSHLKPEGVTLSAKRDALVVVFDRDQDEPQWTRLPLPIAPAR
jgi:hypothetical protein